MKESKSYYELKEFHTGIICAMGYTDFTWILKRAKKLAKKNPTIRYIIIETKNYYID